MTKLTVGLKRPLAFLLAVMLAVMLFPVAGSADSALACYLDRIEIYPEEATIPAGNSITYTAEAFNYLDQSMGDVTPYTTFSIEYEAGGYWSPHNTYNSENVGTWVVTGEYEGKVDTAVLIVELTSGSISGVVFNDIDGDGVRDGGEAGIDGVIVKLDGVVTVTTSGGGLYNFSDLVVGLHDVEATVPPVYVATTPNPVNDVYVGAGGTATVDFGFQGRGNISGVVFNDIDGDGVRDGGEAGIDGVTVKLDGVVTVTTSGGGLYSFIGVAVGDHNVAASTPTGYVGTTPNPVKVTVVLGITVKAYFGFRGSSSICGVVFNDIDGDGVRDGGEAGIDGVTVTLDSMRTVTTSGGGLYSFIGVVAGLHDVESGVPTGYVGTTPNPVNDVYVGAGGTATVDFGFQGRGSISGIVFDDENGNGVQESGELGIGGVTVTLDGVVTTSTGGDGIYSFSDIEAGLHDVESGVPAGYAATTPNPVNDVYVGAGGTAAVDFGFQIQADLSIGKWADSESVVAGEELTYTVEITNNGPSDASGVVVRDELPDGVSLVSADGGSYSGGIITWDIGDLASGASTTRTVVVTVNPGTPQGTLINEVEVDGNEADPNPENNTAEEETAVTVEADLRITKTDISETVAYGSGLTYEITVTNDGPSCSRNVEVRDAIPSGTEFKSATATKGSAWHEYMGPGDITGVVFWSIGDMDPGTSVTLTLVVTVLPTAQGTIINTAEVYSAAEDPDPNHENNTATEETALPVVDHIIISSYTNNITAGESLPYTATAYDEYGTSLGDVTSATIFSINPEAGGNWSPTNIYNSEKAGVWKVVGNYEGKEDDETLYVKSGPLDHFVFGAISSPQAAGVSFTIIIKAKDACGNTLTGYTDTADLSDDTGTIKAVTTGGPVTGHFVSGVWTGKVIITATATDDTITATDDSITGESNEFDVEPGPHDHFVFDTILSPQAAGVPFTITITAVDAYGNTVTDYTDTADLSDGIGTIAPIETGGFTAGVWTGEVTITAAATDDTITATDDSITGESNEFDVESGPHDHFVFDTILSPQVAGVPFTIAITAVDVYGNTVTDYTDTADLSDGTGTIAPIETGGFTAGVWTGEVTITAAATDDTITATDDSITGESNEFNISSGKTVRLELRHVGSDSNTVGTEHTLIATAYDDEDNPVLNEVITWTIVSGPSDFVSKQMITDENGEVEAVITSTLVGDTVVKASVSETVYDTATKTWTANELDHFRFDTISSPQAAGVPFTITITAVDVYGNIIIDYTDTADLSDDTGTIEPDITANFVSGVWMGEVTIAVAHDDDVIAATDGDITGESNAFDVEPGPMVSGFVFDDTDRDGVYDIGDESGIGGVTVELFRGETVVRTTLTAGDGSYSFLNVTPGNYWVVETNLPGYKSTTPDEVHVNVVLGEDEGVDFGDVLSSPEDPAVIYGTVFNDADGNGEQDDGEPGIPDVTVTLDDTTPKTTDEYGRYTFRVDVAGAHTVVETDPIGYFSTTPNEVHVGVTLGESYQVDFGDAEIESAFAVIYGTVFNDADGDGEQGDGEPGIPDVTVTLDDTTPKTTDEYGRYTFRVDVAGAHTVVETDPIGYFSTTPNEVHVGVTLGESYQVDFGDAEIESAFAVIYGTVFNDADGNSIWDDGEVGIPGVTVTLDNTTSKTTDEYGRYTFRVDDGGAHTVVETDPIGYTSTTNNEVDFDVVLGNSYIANFGDRIQPPPRRLGRIVISPETASISAGDTQTYTVKAYDTSGASMGDVTSSTTFSIQVGAGGSWSGNTYTSENVGRWTVTATYSGKSDTATLTVVASPINGGENEGPEEEEPEYFTVDFLGEITRVPIGDSGELLETLQAPSPDGRHLLEIQQGTIVVDSEGNVVTLIEIREAEKPGLPANTTLLGDAYDFQPSGIMFSIPASATLGYDLDDLPENVVSVALACYTDELGWTEFASQGGVVAELGRETAEIDHFTIFAVLARTATGSAPSIDQAVADFLLNNLAISLSRSEVWEFLTFVVTTGEDATITVEVMNIGGKGGNYTAFLKLDGVIVATQKVSLEPGQTETITFNIGPNEPGTYQVEVGGLHGEFESSVWINWGLVLGLPAGLILLALLLWYLRKRQKAQAE